MARDGDQGIRVVMPTGDELRQATSYKGEGVPSGLMINLNGIYRVENGWHPSEIAIGVILGLQIAERRRRAALAGPGTQ